MKEQNEIKTDKKDNKEKSFNRLDQLKEISDLFLKEINKLED